MITNSYRADIDGLRALAIIPVILFHLSVNGVSGGFVGVDVFFVISGFLITSIIIQDIDTDSFSFARFYARRAGRILPALLAVVFCTTIFGFFLLAPADFLMLGCSEQYISFFFSNYFFLNLQTDYWSHTSLASQPMLHTWSLAIEEQFYLLFPIVLLSVALIRNRAWQIILVILLLGSSLVWSLYILNSDATIAFYSLFSRAWELLLGGLVALIFYKIKEIPVSNIILELLGILGVILILYSVIFYNHTISFPGLYALLPCIGAALLIITGKYSATLMAKLLSSKLLVAIGKISYSLYLWHWVVLVLSESMVLQAYNIELSIFSKLIIISVCAYLSWLYIEVPCRKTSHKIAPYKTLLTSFFALALTFGMGSFVVYIVEGNGPIKQYYPESLNLLMRDIRDISGSSICPENNNLEQLRRTGGGCLIGEKNEKKIDFIIVGDSHAGMWLQGLDNLAKKYNLTGLVIYNSLCIPSYEFKASLRDQCFAINRSRMEFIEKSTVKNIILVSAWDIHLRMERDFSLKQTVSNTISRLQSYNKKIIIVLDIPFLVKEKDEFINGLQSIRNDNEIIYGLTRADYQKKSSRNVLNELAEQYNLDVIDPISIFCPKEKCIVAIDGRTLYRDYDHLTGYGSEKFSIIFESLFTKIGSN